MRGDHLPELLAHGLQRSAERLRAEGPENPWPEDLRAQDIVRPLQERSREVVGNEGAHLCLHSVCNRPLSTSLAQASAVLLSPGRAGGAGSLVRTRLQVP